MFSTLFKKRGLKYLISAALNQPTFSAVVLGTGAGIVEMFWCNRFMRFCREFGCFSEVPADFKFTLKAFNACGIDEPKSDK